MAYARCNGNCNLVSCVGVYIVAQTDTVGIYVLLSDKSTGTPECDINSTGTPECDIDNTGTPECDIDSTGTLEWYVCIFKYARKIAPSCRDLDLV